MTRALEFMTGHANEDQLLLSILGHLQIIPKVMYLFTIPWYHQWSSSEVDWEILSVVRRSIEMNGDFLFSSFSKTIVRNVLTMELTINLLF